MLSILFLSFLSVYAQAEEGKISCKLTCRSAEKTTKNFVNFVDKVLHESKTNTGKFSKRLKQYTNHTLSKGTLTGKSETEKEHMRLNFEHTKNRKSTELLAGNLFGQKSRFTELMLSYFHKNKPSSLHTCFGEYCEKYENISLPHALKAAAYMGIETIALFFNDKIIPHFYISMMEKAIRTLPKEDVEKRFSKAKDKMTETLIKEVRMNNVPLIGFYVAESFMKLGINTAQKYVREASKAEQEYASWGESFLRKCSQDMFDILIKKAKDPITKQAALMLREHGISFAMFYEAILFNERSQENSFQELTRGDNYANQYYNNLVDFMEKAPESLLSSIFTNTTAHQVVMLFRKEKTPPFGTYAAKHIAAIGIDKLLNNNPIGDDYIMPSHETDSLVSQASPYIQNSSADNINLITKESDERTRQAFHDLREKKIPLLGKYYTQRLLRKGLKEFNDQIYGEERSRIFAGIWLYIHTYEKELTKSINSATDATKKLMSMHQDFDKFSAVLKEFRELD